MKELIGNILSEDVEKIEQLLKEVTGSDSYVKLERLGGLTNHTYHAVMEDGKEYSVRIPGEGTEEMIIRSDEKTSTELACRIGVDAQMLYFGKDGSKVTHYIQDAVTMTPELMQEEKHIREAADIFKVIHTCGEDTGVPFEVFDMAASYEKIINDLSVAMFDDYDEMKAKVMAIKAEMDSTVNAPKVPCHNDPLCANWVEGEGKLWLVDWEYSGMNDGMWDLADLSIEAEYNEEQDKLLLSEYLGTAPSIENRKHFLASKIYVDYLWTLWAKTRVPFAGQSMEDWACERYDRMKNNIEAFEKL